jgi:hypothetical protein
MPSPHDDVKPSGSSHSWQSFSTELPAETPKSKVKDDAAEDCYAQDGLPDVLQSVAFQKDALMAKFPIAASLASVSVTCASESPCLRQGPTGEAN